MIKSIAFVLVGALLVLAGLSVATMLGFSPSTRARTTGTGLRRYVGVTGRRTLFVAAGTVNAFVDLSGLTDKDLTLSPDGKSLTLRLPESQLDKPRLDFDRSRFYSQERGVLDRIADVVELSEQEKIYELAEKKFLDAAEASELRTRAAQNTKTFLTGILGGAESKSRSSTRGPASSFRANRRRSGLLPLSWPNETTPHASVCGVVSVFEGLTGRTADRPRDDVRRVSVLTGNLMIMTESPQVVNRARDWIAKARSFHYQRLTTHRRVRRLGKTRLTFTTGQALTNLSAFFLAGSTGSADLPDWAVLAVLLGGFLGGKYVFPVPDSSIASRRGPADVVSKSAAELDSMTPDEIRAYENNMVLKHRIKGPPGLGAAQALQRQRDATRTAEEAAGIAPGSLTGLSLVDAQAFGAVAAQHEHLESRWLAYEVDPQLQFDFPAMSDTAFPATAAMIRARRKAEQAKSEGNPANYQSAVAEFSEALTVAEAAAGVPQK